METNNIDKIVRDSLASRTIHPSNSSWERLSNQLDIAQEKKRKKWFLYVGYAATILLLISVVFFMNTDDVNKPTTPNTIVTSPDIDTTKFVKPTLHNVIPTETVIVKTDKVEEKPQQKKSMIRNSKPQIKHDKIIEENTIVIADNPVDIIKEAKNSVQQKKISIDRDVLLNSVDTSTTIIAETKSTNLKEIKKYESKNRIQVSADDLLYATTHNADEVKAYYAKYHVNRDEVLKSIQKELKNKNLEIDANTLLTEVEKTIDEETFKKSFLQVVKGKITGLAAAIANRNN